MSVMLMPPGGTRDRPSCRVWRLFPSLFSSPARFRLSPSPGRELETGVWGRVALRGVGRGEMNWCVR